LIQESKKKFKKIQKNSKKIQKIKSKNEWMNQRRRVWRECEGVERKRDK